MNTAPNEPMGATSRPEMETVVYSETLEGRLCVPEGVGPYPVAVYHHGGLGSVIGGDPEGTCLALRELGFLAFSPIRRAEVPIAGHLEDASAGIAFALEDPAADPTRLAILGFSRGGFLTTQALTVHSDIDQAVVMAPAPVNGQLDIVLQDMTAVSGRTLVLVAENDLPPHNNENEDHVATSTAVHDALEAAGKDVQLNVLPAWADNGHDLFQEVRDEYWTAVADFLVQ